MELKPTVLIVDDEPNALKVLSAILRSDGYTVLESTSVDKAIGMVGKEKVDAIITDIRMPEKDGYQFFEYLTDNYRDIPVMFLTAYGTVDSAVQAMTSGAFYYFIKPPDYQRLKSVLARAIQERASKDSGGPADTPAAHMNGSPLTTTGRSAAIVDIYKTIYRIKDTQISVLIHGETGTGKEIIANTIHHSSNRKDKPFIAVNCAALPRDLIESELFGYDKGAFTGAAGSRIGKIEEAGDGTLFLDEIGELELPLQAKLLRVLQERTIERLGSNRKIKVNFRLISSTNRDLKKEMEEGRFRSDLYYRLNVVPINVPPLRERRDDIPVLASLFVREVCEREGKQASLDPAVLDILQKFNWPGNVRQLKNVIEHAVITAKGRIVTPRDLSADLVVATDPGQPLQQQQTLRDLQQEAVAKALRDCNGNKSEAARKLGISRKALYARLKDAQMSPSHHR